MRQTLGFLALISSLTACSASAKPLPLNRFVEWSAEKPGTVALYQAGDLTVTLKSAKDSGTGTDTLVQPLVIVSKSGMKPITLKGETSGGFGQSIAVGSLSKGAPPSVIVQSYSGGAHCCMVVQALVPAGKGFTRVDLGAHDGEGLSAFPKDVSGDGIADIVWSDGAFNYTFSSYAGSFAPPQIFNIVAGKAVDVSTRPAFRKLFLPFMADARKACITTDTDRNGACAGYVAAAARTGQFDRAWAEMLTHYDKRATDFPTGCRVAATDGDCPEAQAITYRSFPEALRAFLKGQGYLAGR
jgi:hypothetical protein